MAEFMQQVSVPVFDMCAHNALHMQITFGFDLHSVVQEMNTKMEGLPCWNMSKFRLLETEYIQAKEHSEHNSITSISIGCQEIPIKHKEEKGFGEHT